MYMCVRQLRVELVMCALQAIAPLCHS